MKYRRTNGMVYFIGGIQFLILTMGLMLFQIGVKGANDTEMPPLTAFLMHNGIYLVLIPVFWIISANILTAAGTFSERAMRNMGAVLTLLIGAFFLLLLVGFLY